MAKLIKQTEPLYTVRARSAETYFSPNKVSYATSSNPDGRGPRSKLRLLPLGKLDNDGIEKRIFDQLTATNGSGSKTSGWGDFLLTDVQCSMNEKMQIMEVFGDNFVSYFFGRSPTTFTMSGIIFDDIDNEWFPNFLEVYDKFIRGTQLARKSLLLEISLPNVIIIGSIVNFSYSQTAMRDTDIQFNMQVVAKAVTPKPINLPQVDNTSLTNVLKFSTLNKFMDQQGINSIKSLSGIRDLIQNPMTSPADINKGIQKLTTLFTSGLSTNNFMSQSDSLALQKDINSVSGPVSSAISQFINEVNGNKYGVCSTPQIDEATDSEAQADMSAGLNPYTAPLPGLPTSNVISGLASQFTGLVNNLQLGGTSSTLTGFKSSLFSPVFGFLSSITKTIKVVTGDLSKVLMSFTAPVNSVLRDISGLSNEVVKVTDLITSSINQIISIPKATINQITSTINNLRRAAGAITRIPFTLSSAVGELVQAGRIRQGAAVLHFGMGRKKNLPAIIQSSKTSSRSGSMTLPSAIRTLA